MRARRAVAGVWRDLPFWFLWLAPFALLDLGRNQMGQDLVPSLTAWALPFAGISWVRARIFPARRWAGYLAVSTALLATVLLGWTGPPVPRPLLLRVFEISAFVELAVLALHAAWHGGGRILASLFGVGAIYGLILENGGVWMGFFAESGYLLYLPPLPAPLATGLGWCVVFYPLWFCARRLPDPAGIGTRALVVTALALALDLQLDPLATEGRFWVWNPELPPAIRGVPLINFNAWASAVLPFAWAVFLVEDRGTGPPAARLVRLLPAVLGAALVMVVLLSAVTEATIGWPSLSLLVRHARSLAP